MLDADVELDEELLGVVVEVLDDELGVEVEVESEVVVELEELDDDGGAALVVVVDELELAAGVQVMGAGTGTVALVPGTVQPPSAEAVGSAARAMAIRTALVITSTATSFRRLLTAALFL